MSTTSKTVIWVIVAIVVIGGIWWWAVSGNQSAQNTQPGTAMNNSAQPTADNTTAGSNAAGSNAIVSNDNSDASLDQDLANLDTQINGLSSDSASVDQGIATNQTGGQ
jgi:hypothetical protein